MTKASAIARPGNDVGNASLSKLVLISAYTYLFLYYVRIQDNVPGLDSVPWVGVTFLGITVLGISQIRSQHFSAAFSLIFWLGVLFAVSGIGAQSPAAFKLAIKWMFQAFPQAVLVFVAFTAAYRMKALFNWWCLIYLVLAILTIKNAPRGAGDFTWDPNDAALALAMGLPFAFYASMLPRISRLQRTFYWLTTLVVLSAFLLTNSRGGFLSFMVVCATMLWLSKHRGRNLLLGVAGLILVGGAAVGLLPSGYLEEMQTITDTEDNTRVERIRTWEAGWYMFLDNPVLGVGAGNFIHRIGDYQRLADWYGSHRNLSYRSSHSLYLQVLPELGLAGALVYGYILFVLPLRLFGLRRRLSVSIENNERARINQLWCNALISSMAAYAVAGAFISVAYYPHVPIWLTMYSILLYQSKGLQR